LIDSLNSKDMSVRRYAIDLLGKIGDKRALEPLLKLLSTVKKEGFDLTRYRLNESVAKLGGIPERRYLAIKALEEGNYELALKEIEKAIEEDGEDGRLYNDLGDIYTETGNVKKALEAYEYALRLDPENDLYYRQSGIEYARSGMTDHAIQAFLKALSLNPVASDYNMLGNLYKEKGEFFIAIDYYNKAIKLNPCNLKACHSLASLYSHTGESEKAINTYKKILKIDPKNTMSYLGLAMEYDHLGQIEETIDMAKHALDIEPSNTLSHLILGNAYCRAGQSDKAINILRWAVELDSSSILNHTALALAYERNKEYDNALEVCNKAMSLEGDQGSILWCMGGIYYSTGDIDKSIESYRKALELTPEQIIDFLTSDDDREDILDRPFNAFKKLKENKPDDIIASFAMAYLYKAYGNKDEAKKYFKYCADNADDVRIADMCFGEVSSEK
ncbi:MAG: tetratricopeptide repeat protein, partial [Candidatus Eremiobacterota bacterium]